MLLVVVVAVVVWVNMLRYKLIHPTALKVGRQQSRRVSGSVRVLV